MFSNSSNTRKVTINTFQAPPLPRYYVDRPEYSDNLKANLLTNSSDTQAIVVTAIHGLGAVGKSTLATALAYDNDVQSRFPDGILWVTLGQEPNILPMLSGWVQALGDYNFKPTSVEATANHLRTLLYDKSVLLVVDDAWSPDHAQIFNLGGPRCQVLVTTREKAIADFLKAETYSLDVMTLEQSMELLTQKLEREITVEEAKQAEVLVKELGYLPLALELAAAQVADGMSWEVLLGDIQGEIVQLRMLDREGAGDVTDEASLKRLSLSASLNLSVKQLSPETRENFIWLGILPEDVQITSGMTAVLWEMDDERDARDKLAYLRNKALLLDGVVLADGKSTYRLHDLFHDLARYLLTAPIEEGSLSGLGIGLTEAHGIFLEKYRRLTDNNLWHTLPNDGYIHQHLVWHLEKAGKIEEIHGLLAEESKSGGNGWYETCENLGKLGLFLNNVARGWELAEVDWDEDRLSEVIGRQCRYALITASINSLAANLPIDLLVALVKKKVWTPEQGLAYALQKPDFTDKVESLTKLVDYLPDNLKKLALSEALAEARQIQNEIARAQVLSALADKLPEILPEALAEARQIQFEYPRLKVLTALADKLPEILPEALAEARQIQDEGYRAQALSALATKFPELLPEALAAALHTNFEKHRAQVLRTLADKLAPELLPQALAVARQMQSESNQFRVLRALAERLTPELLPQALAVTRQMQSEYGRAEILGAFAAKFPEILPEALTAARQIQFEISRAEILGAFAAKFPEILPEALAATRQIKENYHRAKALRALAAKFPEILPEALAATRQIQHKRYRAEVLSALADKLPEILPEALAATRQIQDEYFRAEVLNDLADKLTPEILPEALAAARQIQDEYFRAEALSALADKLPEILPEALAATRQIQDEYFRAEVLGALADKLPEILPEALAAARQIQDEYFRAEALSALADKLPEILPEALAAARQIQNERYRAEALGALADKLPEILPEALAAARQSNEKYHCAEALRALAEKLTPELLSQALATARQIQDEIARAQVINAVAAKFPEILPEALAATRQIQHEYYRAEALGVLTDKSPEILPEALAAARQIQNQYYRAEALGALTNKLPEILPEALAEARQIHDEIARSQFLRGLADKLTPEILPEALAEVRQIHDEIARSQFLRGLADKLTPEILPEALAEARQIQQDKYRTQVLCAWANPLSQMPTIQLYPLWQNTLYTLSLHTRRELLSHMAALTPVIFSLGGEEAIKNTAIAIQEVSRWWR